MLSLIDLKVVKLCKPSLHFYTGKVPILVNHCQYFRLKIHEEFYANIAVSYIVMSSIPCMFPTP